MEFKADKDRSYMMMNCIKPPLVKTTVKEHLESYKNSLSKDKRYHSSSEGQLPENQTEIEVTDSASISNAPVKHKTRRRITFNEGVEVRQSLTMISAPIPIQDHEEPDNSDEEMEDDYHTQPASSGDESDEEKEENEEEKEEEEEEEDDDEMEEEKEGEEQGGDNDGSEYDDEVPMEDMNQGQEEISEPFLPERELYNEPLA